MKFLKIPALIMMALIVLSCSKDKDPEPAVEQAKISFSGETQLIEVPAALSASQDIHAQMASQWVAVANGMGANLALFTPPSNATKSTDLITPINGRVAKGNAVAVYIWTDANYGSVAYQVQDVGTKYTFELFYKGNDDAGWYRYLYAEEKKDKTSGYMVLYDAWGFVSDARKEEMVRWEWLRAGDDFTFTIRDVTADFNFVVNVNTKTKAGSIVYLEGTEKLFEITWDANGKGTWKEFEDNQVVDEGSWS
jgi:hypothetical protein